MRISHFRFLDSAIDHGLQLTVEYDAVLVFLSYLIAFLASSATLMIASRLSDNASGNARRTWLTVGAVTMGLGVWWSAP